MVVGVADPCLCVVPFGKEKRVEKRLNHDKYVYLFIIIWLLWRGFNFEIFFAT